VREALVIIFVALCIWIPATLFTGCTTVPQPIIATTDGSVVASKESVARLQTINDGLNDIIRSYDSAIKQYQGQAVSGIDAALAALDRYDEFVQYCINRITELERDSRSSGSTDLDSQHNPDVDRDSGGNFTTP